MKITLFNTTFTSHHEYNPNLLHVPSGCDQYFSMLSTIDNVKFHFTYELPQDSFNTFKLQADCNGNKFLLKTYVDMDCIYIPNRFSKEIVSEKFDVFGEPHTSLRIPVYKEEWIQIAAAKFEQKFADYPLGYPFNLLKLSIFQ